MLGVLSRLRFHKVLPYVAVAFAFMLFASMSMATGITLPDTGVDIPGHVTAMATALGTAITAVIGAYAAFKVIKVAIRWFSKVGG